MYKKYGYQVILLIVYFNKALTNSHLLKYIYICVTHALLGKSHETEFFFLYQTNKVQVPLLSLELSGSYFCRFFIQYFPFLKKEILS